MNQRKIKRRSFAAATLSALLMAAYACDSKSTAPATNPDCRVSGVYTASDSGQGRFERDVCSYKGVRFAAPPIAELRFLPPEPPTVTTGNFDWTAYGNDCIQAKGLFTEQDIREDCLFLNIWTPPESATSTYPVMVWFYGGGFVQGTANWSLYNGAALARHGVVVVAVNYRLGPLGYLSPTTVPLENGELLRGNLGLRDQIASLEWVQAHIAAFGGDPANVTIFGESAGAFSVCAIMAAPDSAGLFKRAIMESGECLAGSLEHTLPLADEWLAGTGCPISGETALDCLRQLDAEALPSEHGYGMLSGNYPIVDGAYLPAQPLAQLQAGVAANIDLLAGFNREEVKAIAISPDFSDYKTLSHREVRQRMAAPLAGIPITDLAELYIDVDYASGFDMGADAFGDVVFACPALDALEAQFAQGAKGYFYRFAVGEDGFVLEPYVGSFHGLEVMFVFNNFDLMGVVSRNDALNRMLALAEQTQRYWTRFATQGDPNGGDDPSWPAFDKSQPLFELRPDAAVSYGGFRERCRFWSTHLPQSLGERFDLIREMITAGEPLPLLEKP